MLSVLRICLGLLACAASVSLSAGPIVDGREWYQPADVTGYSWSDFNAVCPAGLCSGQVGGTGPDLTGWVWASVYEVGALFHALTPHPGGIAAYNDTTPLQDPFWAFSFLGQFDFTYELPASPEGGARAVVGLTSTLDGSGTPYWGLVGAYISGYIRPGIPEIDGTARTELASSAAPADAVGAWLYRSDVTGVPAPATLPLLALGLVGVAIARRLRPRPA